MKGVATVKHLHLILGHSSVPSSTSIMKAWVIPLKVDVGTSIQIRSVRCYVGQHQRNAQSLYCLEKKERVILIMQYELPYEIASYASILIVLCSRLSTVNSISRIHLDIYRSIYRARMQRHI